jgi:cation:H+ antiporter
LISAFLIIVGFALLGGGGELLVRGASSIALLARLTPTVVGLTVVAMGTSMPELVVSVNAAMQDSAALALGNVVGSNIFNVGAILGIAALVAPLRIQGNTVRLEWPVMFLAGCQLHLLARDGTIDRLEGGFLFVALVIFTVYVVYVARRAAVAQEVAEYAESMHVMGGEGARAWGFSGLAVLGGVGALVAGASFLVEGATNLARAAGVSETIIGLTVVAAGTSLPELAASVMASLRGRDDIAVANVIGSSIFNVLGILGPAALISPLPVPPEIIARDDWWMLGLYLLLLPIMLWGMRVRRVEGAILLGAFAVYLGVLLAGM